MKIIEMHLKYQVIGTDFVDTLCHGDERQLSICVQILAGLSRGLMVKRCSILLWVCVCLCVLSACFPISACFFSLPGSMIERILVSCNNQQDLHEWVDHLQKQTKVTSVGNPTIKPHSVPSHTVRTPVLLPPHRGAAFGGLSASEQVQ